MRSWAVLCLSFEHKNELAVLSVWKHIDRNSLDQPEWNTTNSLWSLPCKTVIEKKQLVRALAMENSGSSLNSGSYCLGTLSNPFAHNSSAQSTDASSLDKDWEPGNAESMGLIVLLWDGYCVGTLEQVLISQLLCTNYHLHFWT